MAEKCSSNAKPTEAESRDAGIDTGAGDSLEAILTCKICYNFMEDARILLPCTHTFCNDCVAKLERKRHRHKNTIKCPLCRTEITEENIQRNHTMMELANVVKSKKLSTGGARDESKMMCRYLLGNNTNKTFRLAHCKLKIKPIEEVKEKIKNRVEYCTKHTSEPIKMNCRTCDEAICCECKFTTHDRHESESLESAISRYKEAFDKSLSAVKDKIKRSNSQTAEIKGKIEELTANEKQVEEEIDHKYQQVMSKLTNEKNNLISQLHTSSKGQIKQLELDLASLEHSLAQYESVKTRAEHGTYKKTGATLLVLLQSGLLNDMDKLVQQQEHKQPDRQSSFQKFEALCNLPPSMIGQVLPAPLTTHNQTDEVKKQTAIADPNNYRQVSKDLNELVPKKLTVQCEIEVGEEAHRMCLFQNNLFVPCYRTNAIKVFALTGENLQTTKLEGINKPLSLHPLKSNQLVLASNSGLYTLNSDTLAVESQVSELDFCDVLVHDDTLFAMSSSGMYLWDLKKRPLRLQYCFKIKLGAYVSTMSVFKDNIYVCGCDDNAIYEYNMLGILTKKYSSKSATQSSSGDWKYPCLCLTDVQGSMLLANWGRNKLHVWSSESGKCTELSTKVNNSCDAIIANNSLFVLHYDEDLKRKITVFALK